jgi:hypothetical protein
MMTWSWKSLRHGRWRNNLSAYVDGEIETTRAARLEAHLTTCESCREELADLRATKSLLQRIPQAQAPRSFVLAYIPASEPQRPAPAWLGALRGATVAAVAGLAVLLAVDFVSVDLSGMSEEEGAAPAFQSQSDSMERATTETASGAGGDAASPVSGSEGGLGELAATTTPAVQDAQKEPPAFDPDDEARLSDDSSSAEADANGGWNGLRIAQIALGAGAMLLATGWIITARRQSRRA